MNLLEDAVKTVLLMSHWRMYSGKASILMYIMFNLLIKDTNPENNKESLHSYFPIVSPSTEWIHTRQAHIEQA